MAYPIGPAWILMPGLRDWQENTLAGGSEANALQRTFLFFFGETTSLQTALCVCFASDSIPTSAGCHPARPWQWRRSVRVGRELGCRDRDSNRRPTWLADTETARSSYRPPGRAGPTTRTA